MPYEIRQIKQCCKECSGYKVCKKGTKKCYSNKPLSQSKAKKQRTAIILSELRKKGRIY